MNNIDFRKLVNRGLLFYDVDGEPGYLSPKLIELMETACLDEKVYQFPKRKIKNLITGEDITLAYKNAGGGFPPKRMNIVVAEIEPELVSWNDMGVVHSYNQVIGAY